jgi:hypothetical protein
MLPAECTTAFNVVLVPSTATSGRLGAARRRGGAPDRERRTVIDVETPRQRCVEALETLGREFGVSQDVRAVERAEDWQSPAIVMLAEAVAALLIEVRPRTGAAVRKGR